ncbi:MAG TPA: Hsp33 family molecular chaperone HslO [Spirochaetia bacterium]|nr:Hsp33 family molecular chaperone HslO [Spirochaetia bacterium]
MKAKKIENPALLDHLGRIGHDGVDRFLLARGRFRLAVLHGTSLVNQMRSNHGLGILETLILGHAYMASALMASNLKGREKVLIQVSCTGPVGGLRVESSARGEVRGYLNNNVIEIESPLESFDTTPFFGNGTITVTRKPESPTHHEYTGHIEIVHGNLASDLTRYYAVSEQTPTALALSVKFDRDGMVVGAGGLLLQALPTDEMRSIAADESGKAEIAEGYDAAVAAIEKEIAKLPSIGELFSRGRTQTDIVREHFDGFKPLYIGSRPLEFSCDCNRERFGRFLAALPSSEIEDIRENGPFPLQITCHNCASDYSFTREEIAALSNGTK